MRLYKNGTDNSNNSNEENITLRERKKAKSRKNLIMAGKPEDGEDVFASFAKYVAKQLDDISSEMNGSNNVESKCREYD